MKLRRRALGEAVPFNRDPFWIAVILFSAAVITKIAIVKSVDAAWSRSR